MKDPRFIKVAFIASLVGQRISENRVFFLPSQRSQSILPEVCYNILSYRNAPLHYIMYSPVYLVRFL